MATEVRYDTWQLAVTSTFSELVSALSFLGSIFVVCAYARYRHLRKLSFTLVACLALTDIVNQLFDFMSPSPAEIDAMLSSGGPITAKCWAQAIGNGIFELASVFWTGCIALTLYQIVWMRMRPEAVEQTLPRMALFCLGAPTVLTLLPLLQGPQVYGPAGGHATWCWVRPQYPGWVFVCFYVPLWITFLFNAAVHLRTAYRLRGIQATGAAAGAEEGGTLDATTATRFKLVLARLHWYPVILLVVWGPASVNRLLEASSGGATSVFGLYFLQRVFSSSQGLLNAVAYGLTRGVREALLKDLHPWLPAWCGGGRGGAGGEGAASGSGSRGLIAGEAAQSVDVGTIGGGAPGAAVAAAGSREAAEVEEDDADTAGPAPPRREGL